MNDWSIAFAPLVPWWSVGLLATVALVLVGLAAWRRARGTPLRALAFAALLFGLANPQWLEEDRRPHPDVAVILVDESPSQAIGERADQRDAALAALRSAGELLPNLEWREVRAGAPDAQASGTRLFEAWRRTIADVPVGRRAGVIVLSDGQVHDQPLAEETTGPVHLLLTGEEGEQDRRLMLLQAPRYGIVGESVTLQVQIDDLGVERPPAAARLVVRRDGQVVANPSVQTGMPVRLQLELVRAGTALIEVSVEDGPAELTLQNNRIVASINAVRDRLRVLLISGKPHAGERVWRNLLKSDPAVDLVHFTILRPPTKQDNTPVDELSLIAFPVRQLFAEKLDEFDLIVFDRYTLRGLIAPGYLENIAEYALNGGALLVAVGPTYADRYASVHNSAIGDVMPTTPTQQVLEQGFRPEVTTLGERHPVTRDLGGTAEWGRWFRQIEAAATGGQVVMAGIGERPLLVLDRIGVPGNEGRVAQILSDHIWLWARGYEGGGPHGELLRRLAHWLMKEPELEEEALSAIAQGDELRVQRRTMSEAAPEVRVTAPDGSARTLGLSDQGGGVFAASLPASDDGLYRVDDGSSRVVVAVGIVDPKELEDARASPDPLAAVLEQKNGSARWLADGMPALRQVMPDRSTAGRSWIGLQRNDAHSVVGLQQDPLLPAWLMLALSAALLVGAWWRESR